MKVGDRVRLLRDLEGVKKGTEGVIYEDYWSGFMVAWDLPNRPLPSGYKKWDGKPAIHPGSPLRDGFDKTEELHFLEVIG